MRVYRNSVGLDVQSNGAYSRVGRKKTQKLTQASAEKRVYAFTTSVDRLLDNHMVKSEDCNSFYQKTSAQPNQIMGVRKISPHSRVYRNTFCLSRSL